MKTIYARLTKVNEPYRYKDENGKWRQDYERYLTPYTVNEFDEIELCGSKLKLQQGEKAKSVAKKKGWILE